MWTEVIRVSVIGFTVVFITLWILALTVKAMGFVVKLIEGKGEKKSARI